MSHKKGYILSIDQGTTSTRAFIFDEKGAVISSSVKGFRQFYPKPGWVEHDASEIWESVLHAIKDCVKKSGVNPKLIKGIGITNQRETTVLWSRKTGKPIGPAIVWQCRRTSDICAGLKKKGLEKIFRLKTGLLLDPYFSGTKIKWYLDNRKGLREKAKRGDICFGTIDSWLIWKLTGGKEHKTDMTNASRTLVFNIKDKKWDRKLLRIMGIPYSVLPRAQNSGSIFGYTVSGLVKGLNGGIPIAAVMGDQQAALYGHGCYAPGEIKNTYGTGSFLLFNTGGKPIYSSQGLLTTISCDINGRPIYALEGSIFIAGAVMQWLRDGLKIIADTKDSENIIKGLKDTGGVYFVPSFTGLGAPYWESAARGLICGITRGTQRKHIVRAALEAIAYETKDVFDIMEKAFGKKVKKIAVDGGASRNNFLMQFQADILGCDIIRPKVIESTVMGVTHLAGLVTGLWTAENMRDMHYIDRRFKSKMSDSKRAELYNGWKTAVKKVYK